MAVSRWRHTTLGAEVELLAGFAFKSELFSEDDSDLRLLRGDNVAQGYLRWNGVKRWPRDAIDRFEDYFLSPGDVVVAMDRPWIEAGLKYAEVTEEDVPCLLVQRVARLRAKPTLERGFLRYVIASPLFTAYIRAIQTGTAVPHISAAQIKAYPFMCPSTEEQRRICSVLGALDEKARVKRRVALHGQDLLGALFSARFPTGSKHNGGSAVQLAPLREQLHVVMGQSPPGSTYSPDPAVGLPLVQGRGGFGSRFPKKELFTSEPGKRALPGDVLMTVRAPVGEVNIADTEYCIGRGVAALRSPHPAYAEQLVRSLRDRWAAEEAGTVFPAVNKSQVLTLPVIAPPDDEVDAFERDARPFYDVVAGAHAQVARLEALRDLLLPQLLDGRLKVTSDDAGRVEAS